MSTEAITTTAPDYDAGYDAGIAGRPLPAELRGNHAAECGYSAGEAVYLQRDDAA